MEVNVNVVFSCSIYVVLHLVDLNAGQCLVHSMHSWCDFGHPVSINLSCWRHRPVDRRIFHDFFDECTIVAFVRSNVLHRVLRDRCVDCNLVYSLLFSNTIPCVEDVCERCDQDCVTDVFGYG